MASDSVIDRLDAIEAKLGNLGVSDLPLAALQRKLENDWQPDGGTLLQTGSVADNALKIPDQIEVGTAGAPAFQNSWVNFSTATYKAAGYYKHAGRVYLNGIIKSGTLTTAAFTLPVGYRPITDEIFAVWSNGAFGGLVVDINGLVRPNTGSNVSFSLDGVSFRAAT